MSVVNAEPVRLETIIRRMHESAKLTARNVAALSDTSLGLGSALGGSITLPIQWSDVTKTASDVLQTIASWANVISQFGAWTTAQITSVLTSWAQMVTAMGNLTWSQITKTASDVMATISSWANILSQVGAMTVAQITTLLTSTANVISALGNWTWAQITKTASDVMGTISTWTNILTQVGAQTAAQISTMLTNWATVISALGNLAWSYVTKTASDIMSTISTWANILSQVGALTKAQILTVLTSWAYVTDSTALGLIDFATYISNRAFSAMSGSISWAQNCFSTWAGLLTQVGAQTAAQITAMLTNWATVISALGNLAWSYVTKTASDIMTTIGTWANILSQVGAQTAAQITTMLTNWATVVSALGNLAWSYVTKTASDVLTTIASWVNMINQFGAWTAAQISTMLTTWGTMQTALGNIAWSIVSHTAADVMGTIANWTNILKQVGTNPGQFYPHDSNILFNASFEIDADGDGIPDGWTGTSGQVTRGSDDSYSGAYCLKFHTSVGDYQYACTVDYYEISQGYAYVLSFWYRRSTTSGIAQFPTIYCYNASKTYLNSIWPGVVNLTTSWTLYIAKISGFPSGTKYIRLYFEVNSQTADNYLYLDEVKFGRQIDNLTQIADGLITNVKIADATITNAKIVDGTITNAKIASATIQGASIANATLTNALIADAQLTFAKTAAGFAWDAYADSSKMILTGEALQAYSGLNFGCSGSGTVTIKRGKFTLDTGATSGSVSYLYGEQVLNFNNNSRTKVRIQVSSLTNNTAYICAGIIWGGAAKGYGFKIANGYLYGVAAENGSIETVGNQAISASTWYTLEAIYTAGSIVKFYVNGGYLGACSTYMPSGLDKQELSLYITNAEAASKQLVLNRFEKQESW